MLQRGLHSSSCSGHHHSMQHQSAAASGSSCSSSTAAAACGHHHHTRVGSRPLPLHHSQHQHRPTVPSHAKSRQHCQVVNAIHIDRRQHMELAWRRQQEREELLKQAPPLGKVSEVADLQHLEHLVQQSGSSLLLVFLYTRSCGACKALLKDYEQLCEEAKSQQIRAVFTKHNLLDEFDYWSDISVWHKTRVAPTIMFFDEGAMVKKVTLHDVRRMGQLGSATTIREAMQQDLAHMKAIFRQVVFEKAPGARS